MFKFYDNRLVFYIFIMLEEVVVVGRKNGLFIM